MQDTWTIPDNAGILDLSVAFIDALMQKGRRPETLRAYSRDLAAFLGYVGDVQPGEVTSADVEAFLEQLSSEGKAISSIIRARDVVRAFWSWMRSEGRATGNPAHDMVREATLEGGRFAKSVRTRGPVPDTATIDAIVARLWNPEDRLAATLIAATGLGASEVLALKAGQIMFVNDKHPEAPTGIAVVRIPATKGGERMVVVAQPDVVRELKRQTKGRDAQASLCQVPVRTLQHRFSQAAGDAGYPDVTLRDLRQSAGQGGMFGRQ
ncbi:MAG: site-specific integrase [Candidatus Sericytochromatia bacterium]|uniref:Site-specific integrase n=1 Tax=Candidatus Tanganyikabacteria bacterium TaxID=2961651 RepID=A0A937X1E2_9BACT|nr:site-specific integrase [Candidatus Tanganyikabacteria bacterium]